MKNQKTIDIITVTILNKISLNQNAVSTIYTILNEKIHIKNAVSVYHFLNFFNSSSLQNSTLSYIERCFTIVSDNERFLEIEYNLICKILASSKLLNISEIEVLKVINR